MVTASEIEAAHYTKWNGHTPNHAKESARFLGALSKNLSKAGIPHVLDQTFPYHLIAKVGEEEYSLYNGGM